MVGIAADISAVGVLVFIVVENANGAAIIIATGFDTANMLV